MNVKPVLMSAVMPNVSILRALTDVPQQSMSFGQSTEQGLIKAMFQQLKPISKNKLNISNRNEKKGMGYVYS